MKISIFKIVPIVIGLLLSQVQACKSTNPRGWYVKVKKAEYEAKVKELEAARAKEKELSHKLLEERKQNPVSPIIQEEEKVLEMMEDQEIPAGSENRYRYLPAKQDDHVYIYFIILPNIQVYQLFQRDDSGITIQLILH